MEKKITKEIEGEIEDKTDNSILINKIWIKFFDSEKLKDIYEDDYVKVTYTDNTKDGKTYHNGREIILTPRNQINPKVNISDTTMNTLIMSMKDIYISEENKSSMVEIAEELVKGYLKIKALT